MQTILFDLNYLGESSQEELAAYRKLGSVRTLRRLKEQETQRNRRRNCKFKALKAVVSGAFLAFDVWFFASWVDVITHNVDPNPVYQAWNFFVLFF